MNEVCLIRRLRDARIIIFSRRGPSIQSYTREALAQPSIILGIYFRPLLVETGAFPLEHKQISHTRTHAFVCQSETAGGYTKTESKGYDFLFLITIRTEIPTL